MNISSRQYAQVILRLHEWYYKDKHEPQFRIEFRDDKLAQIAQIRRLPVEPDMVKILKFYRQDLYESLFNEGSIMQQLDRKLRVEDIIVEDQI